MISAIGFANTGGPITSLTKALSAELHKAFKPYIGEYHYRTVKKDANGEKMQVIYIIDLAIKKHIVVGTQNIMEGDQKVELADIEIMSFNAATKGGVLLMKAGKHQKEDMYFCYTVDTNSITLKPCSADGSILTNNMTVYIKEAFQ